MQSVPSKYGFTVDISGSSVNKVQVSVRGNHDGKQ